MKVPLSERDSANAICIRGARVHNLQNVDVDIPRDKLVVITGLSGSGKSSLVFDTLYAEGQRQYIESLSVYARQFFDQLERPNVDSIHGLQPTLCIDQRSNVRNPRSTVATVTEIYDRLRLLMSRVGDVYCYQCDRPIQQQTPEKIEESLSRLPENTKAILLAPIVRGRRGEHREVFVAIRKAGFVRVRVNGEVYDIDNVPEMSPRKRHNVDAVVDRIILRGGLSKRLAESIQLAVKYGNGTMIACCELKVFDEHRPKPIGGWSDRIFSTRYACPHCDISYDELEPRTFSFNSPHGACSACEGLGTRVEIDGDQHEPYRTRLVCDKCNGSRLRIEAQHVLVGGRTIHEISQLSVRDSCKFFHHLNTSGEKEPIATPIIKEIIGRLRFLEKVGVDYLTLDRSADTLSGGEMQRLRLATSIGSGLVGVCYILDEPSIGLHPRDNERLIRALRDLQNQGNTVLVVEHDEAMIRASDHLIDVGPAAGENGGRVIAQGAPAEVMADPQSITGRYLAGTDQIPVPPQRRRVARTRSVLLSGACANNLQNIDVCFPLGVMVCVTGVSGSGKSSLLGETLAPAIARRLGVSTAQPGPYTSLRGVSQIDKLVAIDQSPIGRTSRSSTATYTGMFDEVRKVFKATREARQHGYGVGRFSFNVKGGRCETCQGQGVQKIEMNFLPDLFVACNVCRGARFNQQTLRVRFRGKSIADVLGMCVNEAVGYFENIPAIKRILDCLKEVGLGYLQLGQPSTTLSGGEAQRVKLATQLAVVDSGKTLYLLDEPTTGLHFEDIKKLLSVLNQLVEKNNTVIVIEHNLDVLKSADWIIDLGPEGGDGGGRVIAEGTPEDVAAANGSYTGEFLRRSLN